MSQSLSVVYIHLVFSTKNRRSLLLDDEIRQAMHGHLGEVSKRLSCPPLRVGGMADHVHMLARLGRTIAQADWVKELKRVSTEWVREQGREYAEYRWQNGYAAFSVSRSNVDQVIRYIESQPEHHAKRNFQDELRALLRKHRVEWDERYVWD